MAKIIIETGRTNDPAINWQLHIEDKDNGFFCKHGVKFPADKFDVTTMFWLSKEDIQKLILFFKENGASND